MPDVFRPRPPLAWIFLCCAFAPAAGAAGASDELAAAWRLLGDNRAKDAVRHLAAAPAGREAELARAVSRLDLQPVTPANLATAEAELTVLARGEDETAALAAYMQARIWQLHTLPRDEARAAALYLALAERHPSSHWAQLGLVKLALLRLYALPEPAAAAARIAAAEALLPRVTEPGLRRDLHYQLGQATVFYRFPPEATLAHWLEVDRGGGLDGLAQEDLIVQIGELSRRAGRLGPAREYFERYLREHATNLRCVTVRLLLASLDTPGADPLRSPAAASHP